MFTKGGSDPAKWVRASSLTVGQIAGTVKVVFSPIKGLEGVQPLKEDACRLEHTIHGLLWHRTRPPFWKVALFVHLFWQIRSNTLNTIDNVSWQVSAAFYVKDN